MPERTCDIALPSGLAATILPFGATLHSLRVPGRDGHPGEVLIGLPHPGDHRHRRSFRGASIGRYANRIGGAGFTLDGQRHALSANDGRNTLHGGADGFDRRDWDLVTHDARQVVLRLTSPAGDQGFPGALEVTAEFALHPPGTLAISYCATVSAPCPVSLTSHGFFNLAGGGPVSGHDLRIAAQTCLPVDAALIPRGPPRPVAGTAFDFRAARPLTGAIALDHCFCLNGAGLREVACLHEPRSGREMRLSTNQPGLQAYLSGPDDAGNAALCLEPQAFPDAPNRPDFPDAILRPGQSYTHQTRLDFSVRPQ